MTELRTLKFKLRKLNYYKSSLPRLIDCSQVYGDYSFTEEDILEVNREIEQVEKGIEYIKNGNQLK